MYDELWPGGPRFESSPGVFPVGTDAVLLADFARGIRAGIAADLGCGCGIVGILLAWESPGLRVDGIDISPEAADAARRNIAACGLSGRVTAATGDMRSPALRAGGYDLVVSNPPYYAVGRGREADGARAKARGESECTLEDVCRAAGYLTRWGGSFAIVHKPERLAELFRAMSEHGLEPKRLRFVQHKARSAPSLALIEARRGGRPSLVAEAPLILADDDGSDSEEVLRIYHRG